jgi:hypothetical protein
MGFSKSLAVLMMITIAPGTGWPTLARAEYKKSDIKELEEERDDLRKEVDNCEECVADNESRLRSLKAEAESADDPGCNECKTNVVCCEKDFQNLGFTGGRADCYDIWTEFGKKASKFESLPRQCLKVFKSCPPIARDIEIARLEADLKGMRSSCESAKRKLDRKKADLKEARAECVNCDSPGGGGGGVMYPGMRSSNGWDALMTGISAAVPILGTYFGYRAYNKGLDAYKQSYAGYLNQCTTIGVPCYPPAFGGGGGGGGWGGGGWGGGPGFGGGGWGGNFGGGNFGGGNFGGVIGTIFGGGGGMGGFGAPGFGGFGGVGGFGGPGFGGWGGAVGGPVAFGAPGFGGWGGGFGPQFGGGFGPQFGGGFGPQFGGFGPAFGGVIGTAFGGGFGGPVAFGGPGFGGWGGNFGSFGPQFGGGWGGNFGSFGPQFGGGWGGNFGSFGPQFGGGFGGPVAFGAPGFGGFGDPSFGMGFGNGFGAPGGWGGNFGGGGWGGGGWGGGGWGGGPGGWGGGGGFPSGWGGGGGWLNPQYQQLIQASMNQSMIQAQRAMTAQQNQMYAQMRVWEAQQSAHRTAVNAQQAVYGGGAFSGGMGMGGMGMGWGIGGGAGLGFGTPLGGAGPGFSGSTF